MKAYVLTAAALCALISPIHAQEAESPAPSPDQIVSQADAEEWVTIPKDDLLVMKLAPDTAGKTREVVIQLMPPPFSEGWVHNIKLLARSGWYDGISVNRVQDNYVVQWGDPNYDNPESEGEKKTLPDGLKVMSEDEYSVSDRAKLGDPWGRVLLDAMFFDSSYGQDLHAWGWPLSAYPVRAPVIASGVSPIHCYGMVGVGRNYSPDTGSGAELYTVIGHAPRHLDRNIALVGRIIEGMEHLSSLPRGKGTLGFYADFEKHKRTPILSIDVAADLPEAKQPAFEYLSTESETFAKYAEARANRRDPFFIRPAGGADICNIPVPIRRVVND